MITENIRKYAKGIGVCISRVIPQSFRDNPLAVEKSKKKIVWLSIIAVIYSIPVLFGFYFIAHYAVNVPYWDQWDTIVPWTIEWYDGNFDFGKLIAPQNDSRPLVTNVLMLLTSILTALNIKMMFFIGYTVYVICFIVLLYFIKTDMKLDYITLILLIPVSLYMFNPYYLLRFIENLGAFSGPILILSALITLYLVYKSKNSYPYYFSSIGMGVVCTLTGAPGLTIWFAGLVQLVLQNMHRKWQKVAIWIISAVTTFYVYFVLLGFTKEGIHGTEGYSSYLLTALHYPLQKFLCFMGVIGAEVIHDKQIALFFGLIIFFVAIALIYVNRNVLEFDRLSKWYGILTFGTLTSLELALTRSGSESLLFGAPGTILFIPHMRHSLVIFLPIMCIYILTIIYTKNSTMKESTTDENPHDSRAFFRDRTHLNLFLLGIIFILVLLGTMLHVSPGLNVGESVKNRHIADQYILQNYVIVPDEKLKTLHPNPNTVRTHAAKLEQYKLNIFANSDINSNSMPDWNSLTLAKGGIMAIDIVDNKLYSIESEIVHIDKKTNRYIELAGWAADDLSKDGNVKTYLVFKNEDDEIIVPTMKTNRPDVASHFGVESYRDSGWVTAVQTSVFKDECYNISLRILRTNGEEYYELNGTKALCFS